MLLGLACVPSRNYMPKLGCLSGVLLVAGNQVFPSIHFCQMNAILRLAIPILGGFNWAFRSSESW